MSMIAACLGHRIAAACGAASALWLAQPTCHTVPTAWSVRSLTGRPQEKSKTSDARKALYNNRIVWLSGSVDAAMARSVVEQLLHLEFNGHIICHSTPRCLQRVCRAWCPYQPDYQQQWGQGIRRPRDFRHNEPHPEPGPHHMVTTLSLIICPCFMTHSHAHSWLAHTPWSALLALIVCAASALAARWPQSS